MSDGTPKKSGSCLFTAIKWVAAARPGGRGRDSGGGMFVLDGKYELSRETTIKAPPEAVHKQVGDLREWPNWLPFTKQDPSVKTTIEQPTGVGARQHWTSDNGNGKLTFTASDEQKGIEFDDALRREVPEQGLLHLRQGRRRHPRHLADDRPERRLHGQVDGRRHAHMVGPMFEEGLVDLKKKVEAK